MENQKLTTNILSQKTSKIVNKLSKLIPPALLAATLMNFSAFAQNPRTTLATKTPTPLYQGTKINYQANLGDLQTIWDNDLRNLNRKTKSDAAVQEDLVDLLQDTKLNKGTLNLAAAYGTIEIASIKNSRLSDAEINKIAATKGDRATAANKQAVVECSIQHYLELILKTWNMIHHRADAVEIMNIDEHCDKDRNEYYGYYENLRLNNKLNKNGQRDIIDELHTITDVAKNDILAYQCYAYNYKIPYTKDKYGAKRVDLRKIGNYREVNALNKNLNELQAMVARDNIDTRAINNLIEKSAPLLPSMFGNLEMRKGIIAEFAKEYALEAVLVKLRKAGYDVNKLSVEPATVKKTTTKSSNKNNINTKFDAFGVSTQIFNDSFEMSASTDFITNFNKNFGLRYGAEIGFETKYNNETNFKLLGKLAPVFTTKKGTEFSMPLRAGINAGQSGFSVPFGPALRASFQLSKNISLSVDFSSMFNIKQKNVKLGGMMGIRYKSDDVNRPNIEFGFGFGGTVNYGTDNTAQLLPDEPSNPNDPNKGDDNDPSKDPSKDPSTNPEKPIITPGETLGDTSDIHIIPYDPTKSL